MKVVTCKICLWHTSVAYLRQWGRCWHCGEKMVITDEEETAPEE